MPLLSCALHPTGSVMATPSSSGWPTVNHVQTVPSATIWPSPFPASSWRNAMRTCCSTSCHRTPAAWLACLTCWPTTLRSWESSTSLCLRPHSTRWAKEKRIALSILNIWNIICCCGFILLYLPRCKISSIVIFLSICMCSVFSVFSQSYFGITNQHLMENTWWDEGKEASESLAATFVLSVVPAVAAVI